MRRPIADRLDLTRRGGDWTPSLISHGAVIELRGLCVAAASLQLTSKGKSKLFWIGYAGVKKDIKIFLESSSRFESPDSNGGGTLGARGWTDPLPPLRSSAAA
jgi:hypothetical protein